MSWHYSLEPEAEFSLPDYLAGIPLLPARSSLTHVQSCCKDKQTECSKSSQCGTTCKHSTGTLGETESTSLPAASPVRTSVSQVKVAELPEAVAVFGNSTRDSLKKFGLVLSSRKTVRSCEPVDSARLSKTLPNWGMTFAGVCWELGTSVRITRETECGFSHPTPSASDWKGSSKKRFRGSPHYRGAKAVEGLRTSESDPAYPSPDYYESSMGWPIKWTESKPLETDRFQQWLRQHSDFCQAD